MAPGPEEPVDNNDISVPQAGGEIESSPEGLTRDDGADEPRDQNVKNSEVCLKQSVERALVFLHRFPRAI